MRDDKASCRWCKRELIGKPYHLGGRAYFPTKDMKQVPVSWYGGFACSPNCERLIALDVERSMPGHGGQTQIRGDALRHLERNWA